MQGNQISMTNGKIHIKIVIIYEHMQALPFGNKRNQCIGTVQE